MTKAPARLKGRHTRAKLTQRQLNGRLEPGRYSDGGNLYLEVRETGARYWLFRFTMDGKKWDMGLGAYPDLPAEAADDAGPNEKGARELAAQYRRMVKAGVNPLTERKEQQRLLADAKKSGGRTFRQCAEDAIESYQDGWTDKKAAGQWRASLRDHAYPLIGDKPVQAITTNDVFEVLKPIWKEKASTAKKLRQRIERVLDFATALKLRTGDNPARLKGNLNHLLPKHGKVHTPVKHPALPYAEIYPFLTDLKRREGTSARALEFVILTAVRTSEALGAKWSEFDFETNIWTVPADRMKGRKEHRVPLSTAAVALLDALPREKGSDLVFIGPRPGHPLSNMAMLKMLERMGRDDLTVHGFRSTFRDWVAETTAYSNEVAEMALAHSIGSAVEASYRRGDLLEKRQRMMEDWATYANNPRPKGNNVVPIRDGTDG